MIDKKDAGMIAQDIRLAKDKEEQIRIEAQLYATDTTVIRRIAYEAGAYKVGPAEVKRALEILQQGGKNHTLGTLRLWMAAFKNCSSKDVKRILRDYRQKPWADPIPDEEFRKALDKDKEEEERDMAAEVTKETPEPKKEEKASVAQGFSQEETKLILYGLTGLRPKASLVAKAEKDGNFRKWLRNLTPEQVDQINLHGPSAALEAYKTHEDIVACDARMSRHRSLHITVRRHAKEAVEAGWSAEKIRDYLTQQAKATGRHCYGYDIPDLNIYGDYIHAAAVLRLDLKDTKVAFPRELQRMHDLRCAQLQSIRAKEDRIKKQEMTKRFRTRAQELKRFERAGAAFCIIIPSAPEDLKKEGKALNHCVGEMGYDIKMANGKTFIAFLRKIESKETAFVTIEYDLEKKELRQCYGYHDSKPLKDAQTFADEWAAAVTKRLKAEETRERRKAEQEAREAMMKQLDPLKKKYKEATA